jgi:hypothetical protein
MTGPVSDRASDPRLVIVGTTGELITRVSPAARAMHAAVLQAFAATRAPPDRLALVRAAGGADLDRVLAELHEYDVIRLGEGGAVDALGVSAMLRSNKLSSQHLMGTYNQGGSASLSFCRATVITSRRHPSLLDGAADEVAVTVVEQRDDASKKVPSYEFLTDSAAP